mmetsp:Transcript_23835/g.57787  ORF Transcript_23835/g.57787 Transcript_23835/m.57787 type:complete len:229 (-) Transcript_23835:435-1121(-)
MTVRLWWRRFAMMRLSGKRRWKTWLSLFRMRPARRRTRLRTPQPLWLYLRCHRSPPKVCRRDRPRLSRCFLVRAPDCRLSWLGTWGHGMRRTVAAPAHLGWPVCLPQLQERRSFAPRLSLSLMKTTTRCSCTVWFLWATQLLRLPSVWKLSQSPRRKPVWDSTTMVLQCFAHGSFLATAPRPRLVQNQGVFQPKERQSLLRGKRPQERSGAGCESRLVTTVFTAPFLT